MLLLKFKIFVSLEMLSEHVEKYSTIYLQVRSSMIFFFFLFLFFFFIFPILAIANYIDTCAIFRDLRHCTLEIKRKNSLALQKSASPPQNLLSQNEGGRGLGLGREGGKAAQCTATIPPLSWAAMMSAFWLQTAYLCFNSCQEQQISG